MRRSRLVLFMTALLVTAVAAAGFCGPPVGEGSGAGGPGAGMPSGAGGGPGGPSGGAGSPAQVSGLTITPGGGGGSAGGSGSGSPALLIGELGTKFAWTNVWRLSYQVAVPKTNVAVRFVGDWTNATQSASGTYNERARIINGVSTPVGADRRNGHSLDATFTANLFDVYAQIGYSPTHRYTKNIKAGPQIGIAAYGDKFKVTDYTDSSLSSTGKHTATLFKLGAWAELNLGGLIGLLGVGPNSDDPTRSSVIYLAMAGGKGAGESSEWQSFNWEAMLSVWGASKGSLFTGSRWGRYIPGIRADVGYVGYYFNQSRKDQVSPVYLNAGARPNDLTENEKVDFGAYIFRVSGAF